MVIPAEKLFVVGTDRGREDILFVGVVNFNGYGF